MNILTFHEHFNFALKKEFFNIWYKWKKISLIEKVLAKVGALEKRFKKRGGGGGYIGGGCL